MVESPLRFVSQNNPAEPALDIFETSIGWFGVVHQNAKICRIKFGFECRAQVIEAFDPKIRVDSTRCVSYCWRTALTDYASGKPVLFDEIEVDSSWMTPFQKRALFQCSRIPYGATATYGELAQCAGSPGAARAVGTAMRTNRCPIIIPCHRVVGKWDVGGFSASRGVESKQELLEMESATHLKRSVSHPTQSVLF